MRSRGWSGRSGIRYDVNGQTSGRRGTHDRALAMIDKRTAPSEDLRRLYLPADSGRGCGGGRGGRWWRRLVSAGASAASVPLGAGEHDQPDGQAGERGGHNGDLVCDGNVEHDLLTSPRHHCAPAPGTGPRGDWPTTTGHQARSDSTRRTSGCKTAAGSGWAGRELGGGGGGE